MKKLILLALLVTGSVFAQEQEVKVDTSKTATEALREEQRKLDAEQRAKKALEPKPVTYSGFLVEFSKAERKSQFLSLRQPRNPKTDYKNLLFEERTERPKGFVLFSLDF